MQDNDCVEFLQWVLPRLRMRWPGFRKVRAQVCKRIDRRMRQLNIENIVAYQAYLKEHQHEWSLIDGFTRITISRFYRDKTMFAFLTQQVLPALIQRFVRNGNTQLRAWSAGCASGEEPYTLSLLWTLQLQSAYPGINLAITATDAGAGMLDRASQGCYAHSAIKNLPQSWRDLAFHKQQELYCLKPEFRRNVQFAQQDIRDRSPDGPFDLVLCRNLVFTYFDEPLQCKILQRMEAGIKPGGALVIGIHERLPPCANNFSAWAARLGIYEKLGD